MAAATGTAGTYVGGDNTDAHDQAGPGIDASTITASLDFLGVDEGVDISAAAFSITTSNEFSFSGWFYATTSSCMIAGNAGATASVRKISDTSIGVNTATVGVTFATTSLGTNRWHHILITRTTGNVAKLWLDGIQQDVQKSLAGTFAPTTLGYHSTTFSACRLAEIRLYNSDEAVTDNLYQLFADGGKYVSKQTGNWSSTSTWVNGSVPANGNVAVVSTGHTVTVDTNTTVGNSPATASAWGSTRDFNGSPPAIELQSTGVLAVGSTITLTHRGDIDAIATAKTVNMAAGSNVIMDSSAASSPSTTRYYMNNVVLTCSGSSWSAGSFCTVDGNGGGSAANGRFYGADANSNGIIASFTKFKNIGISSDTQGIYIRPASRHTRFDDCRFEGCGAVYFGTTVPTGAADVRFQRVTWTGTLGNNCIGNLSANAITTGVRLIDNCVFDKRMGLSAAVDFTVTNCVFLDHIDRTGSANNFVKYENCIFKQTNATGSSNDYEFTARLIKDCFLLRNVHGHGCTNEMAAIDTDVTFDGIIFDREVSLGTISECILAQADAGNTLTIKNCIVLPGTLDNPGALVTTYLADTVAEANCHISVLHNTCCISAVNVAACLVNYQITTTAAGFVSAFKSNIVWAPSSITAYKIADHGTNQSTDDVVAAADADYNVGYNLAAGSNGNGYNQLEFSSGSPGANDIAANPTFVDTTRNLATWDASVGGAGTSANAFAEFAKLNDSDYDSAYNVPALLAWVRAGFAPTNVALQNAGHDGVTIGAVEGDFGNPGAAYYYRQQSKVERDARDREQFYAALGAETNWGLAP